MGRIIFPQYAKGREGIEAKEGETILAHIRKLGGVEIESECGGKGICGRDIVRIEKGAGGLAEMTASEKELVAKGLLAPGQRLACQAKVADSSEDLVVFMPNFGKYTILTQTVESDTECKPFVTQREGRVLYSTGEDLGPYEGRILGLAVDVGTTTIVMQVVDLETGKNVGKPIASKNPQISYGNDVISRVGYTMDHADGLKELQKAVVNSINAMLAQLEKDVGAGEGEITSSIYDAVAVGNSTMRSILFGQNVYTLGVVPFEPHSREPLLRKASGIGLKLHPEALIYGPCLIGGHAGADCVADIIATRLYEKDEINMVIDIGTNGEVAIGNKRKIMTASCAAGGAYEGYQIRCGVGAIAGAIVQIEIANGKAVYKTLNDAPAVGVCGSGVIDLLAELYRNGIMNAQTRIREDYYVTDGVCICQEDINQLVIAKAGLRSDQDLLIRYYGTTLENVQHIYLAGAFGNYMNIGNAMSIGLLPRTDKNKFVRFGNGALAGARDMLISEKRRRDSERILNLIEHTKPNEIEGGEFAYIVADNMYFKQE